MKTPLRPGIVPLVSTGSIELRRRVVALLALSHRPADECEPFHTLPVRLRVLVVITLLLDIVVGPLPLLHHGVFVGLSATVFALTLLIPMVRTASGQYRVPHLAFITTIALLWPASDAVAVIVLGTVLGVLVFRLYEPWRAVLHTLFWAYPAGLASAAGHRVAFLIPDALLGLVAATLTIIVVYRIASYAMHSVYRGLRFGDSFFKTWVRTVIENPTSQLLSGPLPILLGAIAMGMHHQPWTLFLLTGVAGLTMPLARTETVLYVASQRSISDLVQAMTVALEPVVPGSQAHAERVSRLTVEAGRRLRVPNAALETFAVAARLHDIGLIDAASRTGSPTAHAVVGAHILAPYPDAILPEMVGHHHTPWRQLPRMTRTASIGARILAAAECYDEARYGRDHNQPPASDAAVTAKLAPLMDSYLDPVVAMAVFHAAAEVDRPEPAAAS